MNCLQIRTAAVWGNGKQHTVRDRVTTGGGTAFIPDFFTIYNRNPDILVCRRFLLMRGISLIYLLSVRYINE